MQNGVGRAITKFGTLFEGQFKNSKIEGFFRAIYENGDYHISWRKDGQLHGYSLKVSSSGDIIEEGLYENGDLIINGDVSYSKTEIFA